MADTTKKSIAPQHQPIVLATHPRQFGVKPMPVKWGAKDPKERGPIIATLTNSSHRNAIGTHNGSYAIYRAVAMAAGKMSTDFKPDLTNTAPAEEFPEQESWGDPEKIVCMDPWGHQIVRVFGDDLKKGYDIRPTIAVTKAHINIPELADEVDKGNLKVDGTYMMSKSNVAVTKAAVEHVWYLPAVAKRFGCTEGELRRSLFEQTGGMFPELITRSDLEVFLPPIGGITLYIVGPVEKLRDPNCKVAVRVHDECNGSDVFGSDICTCRPYLAHGIEVCIQTAQEGGVGVIAYFRKEGRALGEVTKFLVYNARKRQEGGDRAETYFLRTECVAGVQDMRFQELMPDVLHWLGIKRIDRLVSMSDMKYNAIVNSGIQVVERVPIPDDWIPEDAHVEMDAKMAAGYFTQHIPTEQDLKAPKGRGLLE